MSRFSQANTSIPNEFSEQISSLKRRISGGNKILKTRVSFQPGLFEFLKGQQEYLTVEYNIKNKKFRIFYNNHFIDINYDSNELHFYASWKEIAGVGEMRGPVINKTIYFNLEENNLMTLITIDHKGIKTTSKFVYSPREGYEFKP